MKKYAKWLAVAGALALCLALTGCYVAPDDVNNGGGSTTVNNQPFLTMPPTATVTVTPDTVVVESPAVPTGSSGGIQIVNLNTNTPAPGTNGWDNWGSGTTPIPTGGTIVFDNPETSPGAEGTIGLFTGSPSPSVTPTPTLAPVTPSPTPPSLQLGFKGSEAVRAVQRRLKELGYYSGSADGDFGPNTEKAVKEFQKANGLSADGKVGSRTLAKLNAKNAVTYKQAHVTPTPKATATPRATATPNLSRDYYLRLGDSGNRVQTLQRRLIELGWLDGKVTGTFDAATETAVRAFQRKTTGLWEDGVAGPDTLKALYSSGAARTKTSVASSGTTLEFGSEGAAVRTLQQKLKDLGYLAGSVDGKFGTATQAAVIAFQKNNNLTADGKAGTATLSKLYSGNANRARGNAANINNTTNDSAKKSGRDTTGIASTGYETLVLDSQGNAVKRLQQKLKDLGYYTGSVDGKFGSGTEAAVMAFQLQNNLAVDGKAGPATQRKLYQTGANAAVEYSSLRMGDSSTAVRNLQYTLYELGYYDGSVDGEYGQTTSDAVRAFQIQNNLSVDGVAGKDTLGKLYSSDAVPATAANPQYSTVASGDQGDLVIQIQDCLIQLGYLTTMSTPSGLYDAATVQAVRDFQANNNITVTGTCDEKTLVVLFGY